MNTPADGQVRLGRDVAPNQDGFFEALRYGARDFYVGQNFGIDDKYGCVDLTEFVDGDNTDFHFSGPGAHLRNIEWKHRETVNGVRVPMWKTSEPPDPTYVDPDLIKQAAKRAGKQVRFYIDGLSIDGCARLPQLALRAGEDAPPCFDVGNTFISRAVGLSVNDVPGSIFRLHHEVQCLRLIDCQFGIAGGSVFDIEDASDILAVGGNYERCLSLARWTGSKTKADPYRVATFLAPHVEQMRDGALWLYDVQSFNWLGGYIYGCDVNLDANCWGNTFRGITLVESDIHADFTTNDVDMCVKIAYYTDMKRELWRPSRDAELRAIDDRIAMALRDDPNFWHFKIPKPAVPAFMRR